jgi:phospholipase/carboxylesterase
LKPFEFVELATGPNPAGTVIWMHGLGADGWDFVPIVRELPLPEGLALRFIFPHAPMRPVTINNGMTMRAWYDIAQMDLARVPDEAASASQAWERNAPRTEGAASTHRGSCSRVSRRAASSRCRRGSPRRKTAASWRSPLPSPHDPSDATQARRSQINHAGNPAVRYGARAQRALHRPRLHLEWQTYPMPHAVCAEEVGRRRILTALGAGSRALDPGTLPAYCGVAIACPSRPCRWRALCRAPMAFALWTVCG